MMFHIVVQDLSFALNLLLPAVTRLTFYLSVLLKGFQDHVLKVVLMHP